MKIAMRTFAGLMFLVWAFVVVGCSGVSRVPVEKRNGLMHMQTTVNDSFAFHPGSQHVFMQDCTIKVDKDGKETYVEPCKSAHNDGSHFVSSTPILPGVVSTVVTAGAIVGGAYLLGDGISKSGSRTNVTNTGGNTSSSSAGSTSSSIAANKQSIIDGPASHVVVK